MSDKQSNLIKDALLLIGEEVADEHRFRFLRDNINKEWNRLEQIAKSDKATKQQQDDAKRQMEALAKGLPALATGLRDAVKGFQSGDAFAGSAAIMDICGALATTVGGLAAAAGPPGAVVAALFSIVSMILKMFVKAQKSLTEQLEEMIRGIKSESKIQNLQVAQNAIGAFITTVTTPNIKWRWADHAAMLNVIDGPSINAIRKAAEWLEEPKNQDLPLWGQVLAAQCHAYIRLMEALTLATAGIDRADPDGEVSYLKLTAAFESNHPIQLSFLQRVTPVARNRGVLWHIGIFSTGRWGDSGPLRVRDSITKADTHHDGVARVFTIARTKTRKESDPFPYLAAFHLERGDDIEHAAGSAYRYRKSARTYGWCGLWPMTQTSGWHELPDLHGLYDICTTPGKNEGEVYLYTANGTEIARYVHGSEHSGEGMDVQRSKDFSFPVPSRTKVDSVCAVTRPRTIPDEDPAVLADIKAVLDDDWVVYGGLEFNGERSLQAFFSGGAQGAFECPNEPKMTGMAIDSKRLWVFTRHFIACVTHASIKHYITSVKGDAMDRAHFNRGRRPDWAYYNIPTGLPFADHPDARLGIQDLAACDDGTLVAAFKPSFGSAKKYVYFATPTFDRSQKGVRIAGTKRSDHGRTVATHGWTQVSAQAHRVYKHPIFCWSLLEGLTVTLEKTGGAAQALLA